MALDGYTIGGSQPSGNTAASTGVLKGFNVGTTPITATSTPADTSDVGSKFLSLNNMPNASTSMNTTTPAVATSMLTPNTKILSTTKNPIVAAVTGGSTAGQFIKDTLSGLPAASEKVSTALNKPFNAAADLLSNTTYIKQAAAGMNAGYGGAAQAVLQKLSDLNPLFAVEGATGGLYKSPQTQQSDKAQADMNAGAQDFFNGDPNGLGEMARAKSEQPRLDFIDNVLQTITKATGQVIGIKAIGSVVTPQVAISGLTGLLNRYPVLAKYAAPYAAEFVKSLTGLTLQTQLDPNLADNLTKRAETAGIAVGTAPLYTALGAVGSAKYSLPASFTLGFGMAKLSGASNKDAVQAGLVLGIMDGVGRIGNKDNRGLSPDDVQTKLKEEALQTLNPYAETKLTLESTPEEFRAAYRAAIHQTHPDVGGTQEAATKVNAAYDLLSRGAISKAGNTPSEPEKSVAMLKGEVQDAINTHGVQATHAGLMENLGVDAGTADRLIKAAQTGTRTPESVLADLTKNQATVLKNFKVNEESVVPTDEDIKQNAENHVTENTSTLIHDYEAKFGNHIGADEAKELVPGYNADRSTSDLVAKAANKLAEAVYDRKLETQQGKKNNTVLMTAGGTGAGKSTALRGSLDLSEFPIVFDTNLSNAQSGIARINKALDKGFKVDIQYVYASPERAYDRVLDRANQMEGSGRPVGAQGHIDMHHGSYTAIQEVAKHFEGNPNVQISFHNNDSTESHKIDNGLAFIKNISDNKTNVNELYGNLQKQQREAFDQGRITEQTNAAFDRSNSIRPRKDNGGVSPVVEGAGKEPAEGVLNNNKTPLVPRGFISLDPIVEGAEKQIKDFINTTMKPITVSENLSDSLARLEGAQQADLELVSKILKNTEINQKDDEALYVRAENPDAPLTGHQKDLKEKIDDPLKRLNEELYKRIKDIGIPLEDSDTYIARFPKEKSSVMQRTFNPQKGRTSTAGQGGILSKSAPSLKKRTYKVLTDGEGNRTVVAIKDGQVTAFRDKEPVILGRTKGRTTNGSTFVDKAKKEYTVGEATTQEIEQHTNTEYYHSALASRLLQFIKLRQVDRANEFLESWKQSPEFEQIAVPVSEIPPEGWKPTRQINFRNYYFEPRTAEILDDMQGQIDDGKYGNAFATVNRVLVDSIFFNGLAHPINVAVTWLYSRGASSLVLPQAYKSAFKAGARALTALKDKNQDYMDLLTHGAHLMSSDVTSKKIAEDLMQKLGNDMDKDFDFRKRLLNSFNFVNENFNPVNFKKNIIYKLSHDAAWLSNDFLTMMSIFENMEKHGLSIEDAIKETARFIPDYRQQSRILDVPLAAAGKLVGKQQAGEATARGLARLVYNRNVSMFGSYHVGLLQSLANGFKDAISFGQRFDKKTNSQRARGFDKMAMLALLMMVVYPWLDKKAREISGNDNTYITRSGITKYPYLAYKAFTGQTNPQAVATSIFPPAVGLQLALEEFFDRDFFTGNQLSGPAGEGRLNIALKAVAPISEAQNVASGKMTGGGFAATLLGAHTPKNQQLALDLNSMIYDEAPKILAQLKAHIAAGDTEGGVQIAHDFNVRLAAQIQKADIAGGNSGSPARVAYFLNQYGVKMPGDTAMTNYMAKQGNGIIQNTLPDGKPIIVKSTPIAPTGVIGAITTYAKAIGTDPVTAFKDIFSGQTIRQVTNGAIIVNRMALSASEAKRASDATAQGLTTPKGMNLDHIVPLEAGGDNSDGNLQLIPEAQWKSNTPIENFLAARLKDGSINEAQVRELAIRFKAGQGETLSPALESEYETKYGGIPLSADEVYDYKTALAK